MFAINGAFGSFQGDLSNTSFTISLEDSNPLLDIDFYYKGCVLTYKVTNQEPCPADLSTLLHRAWLGKRRWYLDPRMCEGVFRGSEIVLFAAFGCDACAYAFI